MYLHFWRINDDDDDDDILPLDARCTKRGIATVICPSVCRSVCLFVRPYMYRDHICKLRSLQPNAGDYVWSNIPKFRTGKNYITRGA